MKIAVFGKGKLGNQIMEKAPFFGYEVTSFEEADVVIDATHRDCVVEHIQEAVQAKKPIIVATTGWYDRLKEVEKRVILEGGFCLYSPNFSLLIQKLLKILPELSLEGFSCHIEETHHTTKKDAPSGTALFLSEALGNTPIVSHRVEEVVGVHKIVIQNSLEKLMIEHEGLNRALYAEGILRLVPEVLGKTGFYDLKEFLCLSPH